MVFLLVASSKDEGSQFKEIQIKLTWETVVVNKNDYYMRNYAGKKKWKKGELTCFEVVLQNKVKSGKEEWGYNCEVRLFSDR